MEAIPPHRIYFSYSRDDAQWLTSIVNPLRPLISSGQIELVEENPEAIPSCSAAVLLLSPAYQKSRFCDEELPLIWEQVEGGKLRLYWIPAAPCDVAAELQGTDVDPVSALPLADLDSAKREEIFQDLARQIEGAVCERQKESRETTEAESEPPQEGRGSIRFGSSKEGERPPTEAPTAPPSPAPARPSRGDMTRTGGVAQPAAQAPGAPMPSPTRKRGKLRTQLESMGSAIGAGVTKFKDFFKKQEREVSLSAFAPDQITRNDPFTLQCWVHWESARDEVENRAKESGHEQSAGTKDGLVIEKEALVELTLRPTMLTGPNGNRDPQNNFVRWEGHPSNVEFILQWPDDAPDKVHETVEVSVEGIHLGECTLSLEVGQGEQDNVVSGFRRIRSAFVSYSRRDMQRVLASVSAFQSVTNVDLFLDVDSIRAGEDWEQKLRDEVPTRDAFFLYWSENAAQSEWVEREWKLALERRGLDYIKPMPLDPISAPEELAPLQFADKWSRLAEYFRLKGQ